MKKNIKKDRMGVRKNMVKTIKLDEKGNKNLLEMSRITKLSKQKLINMIAEYITMEEIKRIWITQVNKEAKIDSPFITEDPDSDYFELPEPDGNYGNDSEKNEIDNDDSGRSWKDEFNEVEENEEKYDDSADDSDKDEEFDDSDEAYEKWCEAKGYN